MGRLPALGGSRRSSRLLRTCVAPSARVAGLLPRSGGGRRVCGRLPRGPLRAPPLGPCPPFLFSTRAGHLSPGHGRQAVCFGPRRTPPWQAAQAGILPQGGRLPPRAQSPVPSAGRCRRAVFSRSMSVPQAMEWLIEHAEDPTIDTPLPGPASPGEAAAAGPSAGPSAEEGDEEARDELTEIFKKIRRKREFRADARVGAHGPGPAASPRRLRLGPALQNGRPRGGRGRGADGPAAAGGSRFLWRAALPLNQESTGLAPSGSSEAPVCLPSECPSAERLGGEAGQARVEGPRSACRWPCPASGPERARSAPPLLCRLVVPPSSSLGFEFQFPLGWLPPSSRVCCFPSEAHPLQLAGL